MQIWLQLERKYRRWQKPARLRGNLWLKLAIYTVRHPLSRHVLFLMVSNGYQ